LLNSSKRYRLRSRDGAEPLSMIADELAVAKIVQRAAVSIAMAFDRPR
jgi:hypothetical protein